MVTENCTNIFFSPEAGPQPPKRNKDKEHKKKKLNSINSLPDLTVIDVSPSISLVESRSNTTVLGKDQVPVPVTKISKQCPFKRTLYF